jgi:hypothetical protein
VAANFGGFSLVEAESCTHVEPMCGGAPGPWGALREVRRSFDASCPTCREVSNRAGDTFWEHGLGRPSSARACVLLPLAVARLGRRFVFGEASRPLPQLQYNRSNL